MQNKIRLAVFIAIILSTASFQMWFMDIHLSNLVSRESRGDLVDSYTDALSHGKPYLVTDQAIQGLALSENEARKRILDASYFNGHYYIYYGIGPFACFLVPWHLFTGTFLSTFAAILIASVVGYAAYGGALLLIFRNDPRITISGLLPLGFVTVIIGSGAWALMDQPAIHQLETASGYAAMGAAIVSLVIAWTYERWRLPALCGAAAFAGLTIACRPNYLPAVLVITSTAGIVCWKRPLPIGTKFRHLILVGTPLVAIALALGGWNHARFGSFYEFGMNYGTGAVDRPNIVKYSFHNIPYNLHRYLIGEFRLGNYFPYIDGVKEGPFSLPTQTHEGVDQIYGSLILFPVLLFGGFVLWKNRPLSTALLLSSGGNLLLLIGLGFGTYRYAVDYLGPASFLAGVGVCYIYDIPSRILRWATMSVMTLLVAWSCVAGLCQATSISRMHGLFDVNRPKDFARLAAPFNRLSYRLEKISQTGPRVLQTKLSFPQDKYGQVEPLLVYGDAGLQDFIYFYYTAPKKVQIGFESIGHGGPLSLPVDIDYAQPHVIDIILGNLLPPGGHSVLRSTASGDLSLASQYLKIAVDGQTLLEDSVYLHPHRSQFFWGESPDNPAFGKRFTGTLKKVKGPLLRDIGLYPEWTRNQFGPLEIQLNLKFTEVGTSQPLVSVGNRPSGAMLVLDCLSLTSVRFKWIHYTGAVVMSEPIDWTYGEPHTLVFSVGSLFPPLQSSVWGPDVTQKEREEAKQLLRCVLDGQEFWRTQATSPDVYPSTVRVGENGIMLSSIADALNGDIISFKRLAW